MIVRISGNRGSLRLYKIKSDGTIYLKIKPEGNCLPSVNVVISDVETVDNFESVPALKSETLTVRAKER